MKCSIMRARCTILTLWMGALAAQTSPLLQKPEVSGAIEVLDKWIHATVTEREEPGLAIGIVYDQNLIWAKGYGFANLEKRLPSTPSTLYRIASITKLFTATAIMQLRDAGKLQLDDPVVKHLPWFQIKEPQPDSPPITIRELLTHTSGLARELPIPYWNDLKFPSREEMMRLIPEQPAVFPPETKYKYSNLALAIAGEVVAAVSGEPWSKYIQDHIVAPLGMKSTLVIPTPNAPGLAIGYRKRVPGQPREPEDFIDCGALAPSASMASSVEDLARFVSLQFRDGRPVDRPVLRGSTLREMQRLQWLRPDGLNGQGLGFGVRRTGSTVRVTKDGAAPGYKSLIEMSIGEKVGVIVLINGYDADPVLYVNQAFTIVAPAIQKATERPKATPNADPGWSKYVGTYSWKHVDSEILVVNGELVMIVADASNPWESRVRLAPVAAQTFKMIGGANDGELLKFEVDENGSATKFTAGGYYRIRKR